MTRNPPPRLLAISDRKQFAGDDLGPWLAAVAASGLEAVQIREKDLTDLALLELVGVARRVLPPATRLLVNGRIDIALAAGADGVHLPSDGLPVGALRRRFGEAVTIGVSTHRSEEVERARDEGADYVTFGPVWPTPSKAGYGPPPGLEGLARAVATGLPVLALGGVTMERVPEAAAAGAAGVAGIRLFLRPSADEIATAAGTFPAPRT